MNAPQPNSLPQVFLNHVFLNHFYVVLDSGTYKAVEENAFLRQHFAPNEKRTTTNAEMTAIDSARGVREIKMQTRNLPESEKVYQLGQSMLKFAGSSAVWSFR